MAQSIGTISLNLLPSIISPLLLLLFLIILVAQQAYYKPLARTY